MFEKSSVLPGLKLKMVMVVKQQQQQQAMASLQCLSGVFWQHQKAADELYYTGHWGDLLHTDTAYNNALTQTGRLVSLAWACHACQLHGNYLSIRSNTCS